MQLLQCFIGTYVHFISTCLYVIHSSSYRDFLKICPKNIFFTTSVGRAVSLSKCNLLTILSLFLKLLICKLPHFLNQTPIITCCLSTSYLKITGSQCEPCCAEDTRIYLFLHMCDFWSRDPINCIFLFSE